MKKTLILLVFTMFVNMNLNAEKTKLELPELGSWKQVARKNIIEVAGEEGKQYIRIKKSNNNAAAIIYILKAKKEIASGSFMELSFETKGIGLIQVCYFGNYKGKKKKKTAKFVKISSTDKWEKISVKAPVEIDGLQGVTFYIRGKVDDEVFLKNIKALIGDNK